MTFSASLHLLYPIGLAVLVSACHQAVLVRGTVDTVTCAPSASSAPERAPLAGASVSVACGNGPAIFQATTDARGRFSVAPAASVPMTCAAIVSKPGYATRRYSVEDLCIEQYLLGSKDAPPSCALFAVTASLARTERQ